MRTLVVSDLHLGAHGATDVLRAPESRAALAGALPGFDRLVLLGDLIELRHGPLRKALAAAEEPLQSIAQALAPGAEVVIVAGNHDHPLIEPWARRLAVDGPPSPLEPEAAVDWRDGEPLHRISALLAPAPVRVAYPGVWLRDDIYATHGHYLDLHMTVPTLERLGAGAMRRIVALNGAGPCAVEDYEAVLAPIYAWIDALAQRADPDRSGLLHGGSVRGWRALTGPGRRRGMRGRAVAAAWPIGVRLLNALGVGPLRSELSGAELRRAGLRAFEQVLERLAIGADHVIFGHTHRAGPLAGDERSEWRTPLGVRLLNSGCWVREPAFLGADPSRSPYRPGFAVVVDDDGPPRLVNLLDEPSVA
ncbi:MAG: metallophosphoesterase [Solirubrobacteraceae bacterium]